MALAPRTKLADWQGIANARRLVQIAVIKVVLLVFAMLGSFPSHVLATRRSVTIDGVDHVHQADAFAGEACAAMFLSRLDDTMRAADVFDASTVDPALGRGCNVSELASALQRLGVKTGAVAIRFSPSKVQTVSAAQFEKLHADLQRGVASIVEVNAAGEPTDAAARRRLVLVYGYDAERKELLFHDPAKLDGGKQRVSTATFQATWPNRQDPAQWSLVRIPLDAERLTKPPRRSGFRPSDYAGHVHRLRRRLPSDAFHVVVQRPFIVVGDLSQRDLRRTAERTVKWAVERLKQEYFPKDPDTILDIWLFKDKSSYETNTQTLFGDRPSTPFGYYSRRHKALIMNISTGGGTLVHEIVHPFMATNFPRCPAWFNEGLASLYEQCGEREGRIRGFTNWRLRGLQAAIRDNRVPPFRELCSTTTHEFYREDPGTNYAQARYLCYYLQEKGLLHRYYHEFRRSARADPTGYDTLVRVLGKPDMKEFQKDWQAYVAKLRF